MLGTLISIIFALIILGVVWWAVQQPLPLIPIIRALMIVIMVLIVLWMIATLLGLAGIHVPLVFR